jgi:heterodisulfide reductase subunit C
LLGSLEKRILAVLRREEKATARDIFNILTVEGLSITYVTVNTVLSRLNKRGLVNRTSEPYRGKIRYMYEYVEVKDQLITDFLGDVNLLFGEEGVEHLKMKLEKQERALAEEKEAAVSHPVPTLNKRVRLSRNDTQNAIIKKIEYISGQNVLACYQCGKCSAGCPIASLMDLLPNQIIRLVQLGQISEVCNSKTIWLCASCYSCTARCPKGVDLARVMEALRLILLRKSDNHIDLSELDIDENLPQIALVSNFRKMTG